MKTLFKIKYGPVLLDIGVILLCVFFVELQSFVLNGKGVFAFVAGVAKATLELFPQAESGGQRIALLLLPLHALLFQAFHAMFAAVVAAVYFAFIRARLRVAGEKKLYTTEKDLTYFRNTFPGLAPATVSILMDLDVTPQKDIPASLLQMMNKGLLAFDGTKVIQADAKPGMSASEAELLRFAQGKTASLTRWKALCIKDAITSGYLQTAGPSDLKQQTKKHWIAAGIFLAIALVFGVTQNVFGGGFSVLNKVEWGLGMLWLYWQMKSFVPDVLFALLLWVSMGSAVIFAVLTFYVASFEAKYAKLRAPVRRTAKGEKAARQLYGIKNYIHDFTILGEATRDKVVLWNDFLVYAIVLEENTDIIKEISRYYPSIKLSALQM